MRFILQIATALLSCTALLPQISFAVASWPAESHTQALKLTGLDSNFTANMSGACWNPSNRTFWVCCNNPGIFWALVEDGGGSWRIATNTAGTKARWAFSGDFDFESFCQADFTKPVVYLMDENGWIRECDVSNYGAI